MAESQAITKVFGPNGPPVTSIKGITGHALGGAGAIEAVATGLSIDRRLIPPTAGYEEPDPDIALDIVHGAARPWEPAPVLSNSFGFGGHNALWSSAPSRGERHRRPGRPGISRPEPVGPEPAGLNQSARNQPALNQPALNQPA